jgi:hypothetical protein
MKNLIIVLLTALTISCATTIKLDPEYIDRKSQEIDLEEDILISITNNTEIENFSQELFEHLKKTYPETLRKVSPFSDIPDDSTLISISINKAEANFGVRIISSGMIRTQKQKISAIASSNKYGSIAAVSIENQPTLSPSFNAHGYWIGTVEMNIKVIEKSDEKKEEIEWPIYAEDYKNNMWGYISANKSIDNAWKKANIHLLNIIDGIIQKNVQR